MKPLHKKIIIKSIQPEYNGLLVGVTLNETSTAKVMAIGSEVTLVKLEDTILVDWKKATNIGGDMFSVSEDDVMGIIED